MRPPALDVGRLRRAHQLEETKLLDLHLIARLEHLHFLQSERDFSGADIQLRFPSRTISLACARMSSCCEATASES